MVYKNFHMDVQAGNELCVILSQDAVNFERTEIRNELGEVTRLHIAVTDPLAASEYDLDVFDSLETYETIETVSNKDLPNVIKAIADRDLKITEISAYTRRFGKATRHRIEVKGTQSVFNDFSSALKGSSTEKFELLFQSEDNDQEEDKVQEDNKAQSDDKVLTVSE